MAKLQRWDAPPTCSFCGKTPDRVARCSLDLASGFAMSASTFVAEMIASDTNPPAPADDGTTPGPIQTMGAEH